MHMYELRWIVLWLSWSLRPRDEVVAVSGCCAGGHDFRSSLSTSDNSRKECESCEILRLHVSVGYEAVSISDVAFEQSRR